MNKKRIMSFDGLKGIAIIFVVLYHLLPSYVPGGFLFVNTFLVIGGFFFARSYERLQSFGQPIDWKKVGNYTVKTISRLFYPLLWMMMAIVIGWMIIDPVQLKFVRGDLLSGLFFVNNLFQIVADRSYFVQMTSASPFTHLWYNAIYVQSIVIGMALMTALHKMKLNVALKGIIWLVITTLSHILSLWLYVPGQDPSRVYYGIDTRFSSFALGIALAYIVPTMLNLIYNYKYKKALYNLLALIALVTSLYLALTVSDQDPVTYMLWMPVYNFISGLLVFSIAAGAPFVTTPLSIEPLAQVGKRSYSYYLWYYPVIVFFLGQYRQLGENMNWVIIGSIVSLAIIGEISYRLIEKDKLNIWYTTHFKPDKDLAQISTVLEQRNFLDKEWLKFIASVVVIFFFVKGILYSANNKSLAQFDLEYRMYQQSPNIQQLPYRPEGELKEIKTFTQSFDDTFNTAWFTEVDIEDPVETLLATYYADTVEYTSLGEIFEEYEDRFKSIKETYPIVYEELTPEEMLFAINTPVTFFGDSLAYITAPYALDVFQSGNYFGQGSLQIWDAIPIFEDMVENGEVQENVVVILGTNAGLDQESMDDLMAIAGEERNVFFVNTNSRVFHIQEVNDIIDDTAEKYDNAYAVDWYNYQRGNPDWYTVDEIHHSEEGMERFMIIVARTMYEVLGTEFLINFESQNSQ